MNRPILHFFLGVVFLAPTLARSEVKSVGSAFYQVDVTLPDSSDLGEVDLILGRLLNDRIEIAGEGGKILTSPLLRGDVSAGGPSAEFRLLASERLRCERSAEFQTFLTQALSLKEWMGRFSVEYEADNWKRCARKLVSSMSAVGILADSTRVERLPGQESGLLIRADVISDRPSPLGAFLFYADGSSRSIQVDSNGFFVQSFHQDDRNRLFPARFSYRSSSVSGSLDVVQPLRLKKGVNHVPFAGLEEVHVHSEVTAGEERVLRVEVSPQVIGSESQDHSNKVFRFSLYPRFESVSGSGIAEGAQAVRALSGSFDWILSDSLRLEVAGAAPVLVSNGRSPKSTIVDACASFSLLGRERASWHPQISSLFDLRLRLGGFLFSQVDSKSRVGLNAANSVILTELAMPQVGLGFDFEWEQRWGFSGHFQYVPSLSTGVTRFTHSWWYSVEARRWLNPAWDFFVKFDHEQFKAQYIRYGVLEASYQGLSGGIRFYY